eukprot:15464615-Alexandrium_andersonii.AAC.1
MSPPATSRSPSCNGAIAEEHTSGFRTEFVVMPLAALLDCVSGCAPTAWGGEWPSWAQRGIRPLRRIR